MVGGFLGLGVGVAGVNGSTGSFILSLVTRLDGEAWLERIPMKIIPQETRSGDVKIATTLLLDVYRLAAKHGYEELSEARLQEDIGYVVLRCAKEGIAFLTETLPRLGKAFDRALLGDTSELSTAGVAIDDNGRPTFLNGLFKLVLSADGGVLPSAPPQVIRWIRQVLFLFYKLKLPIPQHKIDPVLEAFISNERDLQQVNHDLLDLKARLSTDNCLVGRVFSPMERIVTSARWYLSLVLKEFSIEDVYPAHGPGATSGKEEPWEKWDWTDIPDRTAAVFPLDAFFYASVEHMRLVADSVKTGEPLARVILVPKDSRGPRLISAEPKELQYLQQGVMRELVRLVENHPLTKWSVFFTNQRPNHIAALLGSSRGVSDDSYATLDLKDASDLVSLELVRLLFPDHVLRALEACRSVGTVMPNGDVLMLRKHAPMGSAVCFPVMALCIWALVAASHTTVIALDPWLRRRKTLRELEGIHVYGDDLIVPIGLADTAIAVLERFGLRLNPHKCCINGFFRESCGVDAYRGENVTPLRISMDWETSSAQQQYCSYIDYANSLGRAGYYLTGLLLARRVMDSFPGTPSVSAIPYEDAPALLDEYFTAPRLRTRTNRSLQRREVRVRVSENRSIVRKTSGWTMLLRYFNRKSSIEMPWVNDHRDSVPTSALNAYTKRHDSVLTWRWCATAPKGAGA